MHSCVQFTIGKGDGDPLKGYRSHDFLVLCGDDKGYGCCDLHTAAKIMSLGCYGGTYPHFFLHEGKSSLILIRISFLAGSKIK